MQYKEIEVVTRTNTLKILKPKCISEAISEAGQASFSLRVLCYSIVTEIVRVLQHLFCLNITFYCYNTLYMYSKTLPDSGYIPQIWNSTGRKPPLRNFEMAAL